MAGRSLPPVSAKVIADIEQFVADFKRAENVTRRTASNIDKELESLAKKTAKKFQLGDIGKDILKGAGLFGGVQIAMTVSELMVSHFREAAEAAKELEASTMRAFEAVRKAIALRQTDDQRIATLQKEFERKGREVAEAAGAGTITLKAGRAGTTTIRRDLTREEQENVHKLTAEYHQLGEEIEKIKAAQRTKETELATAAAASRARGLAEALREQEKAFDGLVATQKKSNDETERLREQATRLAEKYKEMADPTLVFRKQIEEANAAAADGKITFEEAARAVEALNQAMDEDYLARERKSLHQMFDRLGPEDVHKVSEAARDMGFAFQSAFEDAVVGGEKLADVLRGLTQDLLRMGLRLGVTNPLVNAAFGLDLPVFGGGRAAGGPVESGRAYMVGEAGPEVFVPRQGGAVVPSGAGGGAVVINQTNHFATGVTRQEIAGLLPQIYETSKRGVFDAIARGGAARKAIW